MMRKVIYLFSPKSNTYLVPGQFWAIPLGDWVGEDPATAETIAGTKTLKQGGVHIKTIHETALDGLILGYRSLEEDRIEPYLLKSQEYFPANATSV